MTAAYASGPYGATENGVRWMTIGYVRDGDASLGTYTAVNSRTPSRIGT